MNTSEIIAEIEKSLTGDPRKDGPFLKDQAEKYKNSENSTEINRELARLLYEISKKDYESSLYNYLDSENQKVNEQIENARKRFDNRNYSGGIKILEEIIRNNLPAWNDTSEFTYKALVLLWNIFFIQNFMNLKRKSSPLTATLPEYTGCIVMGL